MNECYIDLTSFFPSVRIYTYRRSAHRFGIPTPPCQKKLTSSQLQRILIGRTAHTCSLGALDFNLS